jgi:hypothetical protein
MEYLHAWRFSQLRPWRVGLICHLARERQRRSDKAKSVFFVYETERAYDESVERTSTWQNEQGGYEQ